MSLFSFSGVVLTIDESSLSEEENKLKADLIKLGDSLEMALWTIEHQERKRPDNRAAYERCYV